MRTSTPDITRSVTPDGDVLVVEAISVEEALAAVPQATPDDVLDVERVLRGGVGGFFAKEMFVVTLRTPGAAVHDLDADDAFELDDDTDEIPDRLVVDARPTGIDAVIAQMALEEDAREMSFGALLQQHMRPGLATPPADAPAATGTPLPPPPPAPAPAPEPVAQTPEAPTLRHPVAERRPEVRAWTPPRLDEAPAPAPAQMPSQVPAPTGAVDPAPGTLASVIAQALAQEAPTALASPPTAPRPAPAPLPEATGATVDASVWNLDVVAPSVDVWGAPAAAPAPAPAQPAVAAPAPAPVATQPDASAPTEAEIVADLLDDIVDAEVVDEPTEAPAAPVTRAVPAPVLPTPVARQVAPERHASTGTAWSVQDLLALGIPDTLLGDLPPIDPEDEYAWMRALAAAVAPLCRPLPAGQSLLAGPAADRLAEALGVPLAGQAPFLDADTAAVVLRNDEGSRSWFAHARTGRWIHVVVGGGPIVTTPTDDTLAVSWVGDEALPQALTLAARHGLVLGFGLDPSRGSTGLRAHPIDVAVAVRRLLPRRTV